MIMARTALMGGLGSLIVSVGSLMLFIDENWWYYSKRAPGVLDYFLYCGGLLPLVLGLIAGLAIGWAVRKEHVNPKAGAIVAAFVGVVMALPIAWILSTLFYWKNPW